MADRRVRLITKQTAVPGRIPTGTTGFEDNLLRQGELAQNTADKKLFGFDGSNVFEFGSNSFLYLTGGTIAGDLRITGNLSAATFISGSTNLYSIFQPTGANSVVGNGLNTYTGGTFYNQTVNISALTINSLIVSGNTQLGAATATSLSGGTISGGTIFSGSTDLSSIFLSTAATFTNVALQNGINTFTGGTASLPNVNVTALSINTLVVSGASQLGATTTTSFSGGTVSGGTLYSGSTNLYDIFLTSAGANDTTRVQPGTNTYTGGTGNFPTVNVSALTINTIVASGSSQLAATTASSFSGGTLSGGTLFSGSTNLNSIFQPAGANSVVGNGTNTYTGGTFYNQTVNVSALTVNTIVASGATQLGTTTASSFSGGTISGGTIYSGSTDLYNIFSTTDNNDITRVQPGTNTYTGGTGNLPTINVSALTINTLTASGNSSFQGLTATTLSSTTISAATISIVSTPGTTAFEITNSNNQKAFTIFDSDLKARYYSGGGLSSPSITFQGNADHGLGTDTNRVSLITNNIARLIVDKTTGFVGIGTIGTTYLLEVTGATKTDVLTANTIMAASITGSSLSATTISGGTILSGSTNLYSIFQPTGANSVVGNGTNTYTGGTFYNQTVNVSALTINTIVASGSSQFGVTTASSFSGGTISGGTLFSGSTNLNSIFHPLGSIQAIGNGINTYTGGTFLSPTVNVSALTVNTIVASGSTQLGVVTATSISGGTVSGGTIYSGGTDLYGIFHQKNGYLLQKQGSVTGSTFAGNPKTASVTFTTPFPNNNYAVVITGEINRTWTVQSKTASGFTISANANPAFNSSNVFWIAGETGEGYR